MSLSSDSHGLVPWVNTAGELPATPATPPLASPPPSAAARQGGRKCGGGDGKSRVAYQSSSPTAQGGGGRPMEKQLECTSHFRWLNSYLFVSNELPMTCLFSRLPRLTKSGTPAGLSRTCTSFASEDAEIPIAPPSPPPHKAVGGAP